MHKLRGRVRCSDRRFSSESDEPVNLSSWERLRIHNTCAWLRLRYRLENDDRARHIRETVSDEGAHRAPVETAQAAPDRRDGDGADAAAGECCGEAAKLGLDVADRAAVAPVTLGGEVDDPPGSGATGVTGVEHEHAARPQPALGAGAAVGAEGVGVAAPELEGEAGACDADAVDGIDDALRSRYLVGFS